MKFLYKTFEKIYWKDWGNGGIRGNSYELDFDIEVHDYGISHGEWTIFKVDSLDSNQTQLYTEISFTARNASLNIKQNTHQGLKTFHFKIELSNKIHVEVRNYYVSTKKYEKHFYVDCGESCGLLARANHLGSSKSHIQIFEVDSEYFEITNFELSNVIDQ